MNNRLLTAKELAELLNVKPVTVYAWVKQRKIPHVVLSIGNGRKRIKETIRFRLPAIEAWLKKQEREARGVTKWDTR